MNSNTPFPGLPQPVTNVLPHLQQLASQLTPEVNDQITTAVQAHVDAVREDLFRQYNLEFNRQMALRQASFENKAKEIRLHLRMREDNIFLNAQQIEAREANIARREEALTQLTSDAGTAGPSALATLPPLLHTPQLPQPAFTQAVPATEVQQSPRPVIPKKPAKKKAKAQTAPGKQKQRKKGLQLYRVPKSDRPKDQGGLSKAIYAHCDLMWNLHYPHDVPSEPPALALAEFVARVSVLDQHELWAKRSEPHTSDPDVPSIQVARLPSSGNGGMTSLKPHLRSVRELHCAVIRQICARHHLQVWCPDLRRGVDAYSHWNITCRIAFYDSFCAVMLSGGWDGLAPNQGYVTDAAVVIQLYDHYVHHYQRHRFLAEAKRPGSVKEVELNRIIYARRTRLCEARYKYLANNKYPKRYLDLMDPRATSDDEWDPDTEQYLINARPERSAAANTFIRILDEKMKYDKLLDGGRKKSIVRVERASPKMPVFPALPRGMPIDYFDPLMYNSFSPARKLACAAPSIVFPPSYDIMLTHRDTSALDEGHVNGQLGLYEIPTDEDMEAVDDGGGEEERDTEDGLEDVLLDADIKMAAIDDPQVAMGRATFVRVLACR